MAIHRSTDADGFTVTFVLGSEEPVSPVSVVGSFNDWTPGAHPLEADSDGSRSVTIVLPVETDVYFRYLGSDGFWFDDPEADEITAEGSVLWASAPEPPAEAAVATPAEPAVEGQPEMPEEDQPETAAEAEPEASAEASAEAQPEAQAEADSETPDETRSEASAETKPETPDEAEPETSAEAQPETSAEAEPETSAEAQPETPDETGDRLASVADRISAAKTAAQELVDLDVLDPDAVDGSATESGDERSESTST